MFNRTHVAAVLLAAAVVLPAGRASAQGEIVITQTKALAGNVTPNDAAGFPITLSRSGAYILGSNLDVPAGKDGLEITVDNVDIDMNGFRLDGRYEAGRAVFSTRSNSRIHDGVIRHFGHGVALNGSAWIVENMQIIENQGVGIIAGFGSYHRILDNNISKNGRGISCGNYCHIEGNTVSGNRNEGIGLDSGTVLGNTIFINGGEGIIDPSDSSTGFGSNTIVGNNSGGPQVTNVDPLQPNFCKPGPC